MTSKFYKIILPILFLLSFQSAHAQQDAQFSQYMFNGLYINPAYAGYKEQWNLNMFYRTQWAGLPGAPRTFSAAVDGVVNDGRVGLGLQVVNDQLGAEKNTALYGTYAYRIPLDADGNRRLAIGVSAGFIQQRLNMKALNPAAQNDALLMNAKGTAMMPDARFGIYYNTERFFAGVSADNLVAGSFQKSDKLRTYLPLKPSMYYTVGGLVPLSEDISLKPSLLVKEDFAGPTSADVSAFVLFHEKLWIGASYRTAVFNKRDIENYLTKAGAVTGMVDFFINSKLRIGYAYDQTLNGTGANSYATHEFSINYTWANPKARMLSPRYF
ncbi:PorP/SprF family type IX secretion system membrane protein [Chitinophaga rhizophila]|uniref:Type IX secretion system membrane protein PorP/SprF n=1 Tax=Chitinophaga rhizophila TaxID=2866212 RepID=A0ABS7GA41_9BACT|nr:type IX secretion system membrane protein PorP/SprF [Chitinophaga rhizophila]MBW8684514.1 type IX secretion system membrane protein PorP/SprF [Chitinophaga rhizophila]